MDLSTIREVTYLSVALRIVAAVIIGVLFYVLAAPAV